MKRNGSNFLLILQDIIIIYCEILSTPKSDARSVVQPLDMPLACSKLICCLKKLDLLLHYDIDYTTKQFLIINHQDSSA